MRSYKYRMIVCCAEQKMYFLEFWNWIIFTKNGIIETAIVLAHTECMNSALVTFFTYKWAILFTWKCGNIIFYENNIKYDHWRWIKFGWLFLKTMVIIDNGLPCSQRPSGHCFLRVKIKIDATLNRTVNQIKKSIK